MPPALSSNVVLNLLPESSSAWDITQRPAPAPAAIARPGKSYLARAANTMVLGAGPLSGIVSVATGDGWQTALFQAGVATFFALAFLRPFAHLAARALTADRI